MAENSDVFGLIWITGLSGAGKTTFANMLQTMLIHELACNPILLDGDALRQILNKENTHTPTDRQILARQYGALSALLVAQKHCVICSTISMFQSVREDNRIRNMHYCEVFIDVDDDVRHSRRDVGSLTKQDIKAEDSVFQLPQHPDIFLKNPSAQDMQIGCNKVLDFMKSQWIKT